MSCQIESPIDQCLYSVSGIRSLFIANSADICCSFYDQHDRITGLTMSSLLELKFTNQFADAKERTENTFNGWLSTQTIDFSVSYDEYIKRQWLEKLKTSDVKCIIESANGNIFLYGEQNGMKLQQINSGIGVGGSSLNGFNWNITGAEKVQARELGISIDTIRASAITGGTITSNCSAYSATTWGSTTVTFFTIQNCLFSNFT